MHELTRTIRYTHCDEAQLEDADRRLLVAARAATALAYAPYSQFRVGAAALLDDGTVVPAANLENAAYPQCLCAEATLLGAVHTQHPGRRIVAVAVATRSERPRTEPAAPCGSCRQQLYEAEGRQGGAIRLLMEGVEGECLVFASVGELLPFGFRLGG